MPIDEHLNYDREINPCELALRAEDDMSLVLVYAGISTFSVEVN